MLSDIPEAASLDMPSERMACIELRNLNVNGVDLQPVTFPYPSQKMYLRPYNKPKVIADNLQVDGKKNLLSGIEEVNAAFPCPVLTEAAELIREQRDELVKLLKSLGNKDGPLEGDVPKNVCFSVGGQVLHTTDASRSFEIDYYREKDSSRPTQVGSGEGCYLKAPPTFNNVYLGACIDAHNVEAMSWGYEGNEGVGMSREGYHRRWLALHDPHMVAVRSIVTGGKQKAFSTVLVYEIDADLRDLCPDAPVLALGVSSVTGALDDAIRSLWKSEGIIKARYGADATHRPSLRVAVYYNEKTAPRMTEYVSTSRHDMYRNLVEFRRRFGGRSVAHMMDTLGQVGHGDHARWVRRLFGGTPLTYNDFRHACSREPTAWASASTDKDWHALSTLRCIMEDYMHHTGDITEPPSYKDMLKDHFAHVDPSVKPQYALGVACAEAYNIAYQVGKGNHNGSEKAARSEGAKLGRLFERQWVMPLPKQPRKYAHKLPEAVSIYLGKAGRFIGDGPFQDAMSMTGDGTELIAARWTLKEKAAFSLGYAHGRKLIQERLEALAAFKANNGADTDAEDNTTTDDN